MKPLNISRSVAMEMFYCTFPILALLFPGDANVVLYTGAVLIAILNFCLCVVSYGLKNPMFADGFFYDMVNGSQIRINEVFMFTEIINVTIFTIAVVAVAFNVPYVSISLAAFTAMRVLHMKCQRDLVHLVYVIKRMNGNA